MFLLCDIQMSDEFQRKIAKVQGNGDLIYICILMSESIKRKMEKINLKLPDLKRNEEEEDKERELTGPPILKKGNLKPISREGNKSDHWNKLNDIFEKTQTEFSLIYKQIFSLIERQDSFYATMMEHITNNPNNQNYAAPTPQTSSSDLEPRYRFFLVAVPFEGNRKIDHEKLKRWLGKVLTETFSVAFHRYSKGEMSFEQTKIYCSSNILRNMAWINEKIDLRGGDLELLEEEMSRLLGYLQLKYPLTESTEINKALEIGIEEVDNMGLLAHNYFASSQIVFQWRESGKYNDLIMKMLNDVFSRIDLKSSHYKGSNFHDFKNFMTQLFDTIEEEEEEHPQEDAVPGLLDFIMDRFVKPKSVLKEQQPSTGRNMKDSSKIRQEKENYRNKVREYTQYSIGRKVPESFVPYSSKDIQSKNLKVKSPAVLRVLSKWAQELRSKFRTPSYFVNLSDSIKSQKGGTVHSLLYPLRLILDEQIRKEEQQIQAYLARSARDNVDLQLKLLRKELSRQDEPFGDLQLENICGRYSVQVVNSLHSSLIDYLNRLIHALTTVSKRFHQKIRPGESEWMSPPDLVTFTIGDLLRCKISSREKEILRIYDKLKQLSLQFPDRMKIIRVKNRLTKSTNDILVNVKFNNLITAEVQLAVKTNASHFITCSNNFCHYLYELQRSPFGAMAELCNVWTALERTSDYFKEALEAQAARQTPIRAHSCPQAILQPFDRPFICYTCEVAFYHNNYLRSHGQCQMCKETICAKCLLARQDPSKLKSQFISNKSLRSHTKQIIERITTSLQLVDRHIPNYGICLSIERRSPRVQLFKLISHGGQRYILGREGGELYEIEKVQTQKQTANFLRGYLIFQLDEEWGQKQLRISDEEGLQKYILPRALSAVYGKSKESLVVGHQLPNDVLSHALSVGKNQNKDKIRKIFLDCNQIQRVSFLPQHFPNLVLLELSYNPIKSLQDLQYLSFLKSLSLVDCKLASLPESLLKTTSLIELRLSKNKLTSIKGVSRLQRLQLLDISYNSIQELPEQIGQCLSLVLLRVQNNLISKLTADIQLLKDLRGLYLSNNSLIDVPQEIGQVLGLQVLDLSHNHLEQVPEELTKLFNLEHLDLSFNQLESLPHTLGDLQSLKKFDASNNPILNNLPPSISELTQLQSLDISSCSFQVLSQGLVGIVALQELKAANNRLSSLPPFQGGLLYLDLSHNRLESKSVQDSFLKLMKLEHLDLNNNFLSQLPNLLECEYLSKVDVSFNKIITLSEQDVMGLDTLTVCNLSKNYLEQIPSGLFSLPKLRELNLASNKLKTLGDIQILWPSLLNINLSDNQLDEMPLCLLKTPESENSHIISIDISSNQIQELPVELVKLKNLKVFKCARNNLKKVTGELQNFIKEKMTELEAREILDSPYRRTFTRPRKSEKA